jgi:two-component system, OmpR family, alkaline phosphatase synthesis response regulator PhoP
MVNKMLIVDDEESILQLLSDTFEAFGNYEIRCTGDGQEALRIAKTDKPAIILLDVRIPTVNGFEVCRTVKLDPSTSRIKVLMLSGLVQPSDWQKADEVGADGFIPKPFNLAVLVEKVEKLLRSSPSSS